MDASAEAMTGNAPWMGHHVENYEEMDNGAEAWDQHWDGQADHEEHLDYGEFEDDGEVHPFDDRDDRRCNPESVRRRAPALPFRDTGAGFGRGQRYRQLLRLDDEIDPRRSLRPDPPTRREMSSSIGRANSKGKGKA